MHFDQAVILTEGRLDNFSGLKDGSERKVLGLSLFKRVLLTAYQAGVTDFYLVGNDENGEVLLSSLQKDGRFRKADLSLNYISSAGLADPERLRGLKDHVWLMEDKLVFSPKIMERAALIERGDDKDILVINMGLPRDAGGEGRPPLRGSGDYAGLALCRRKTLQKLADVVLRHPEPNLNFDFMSEVFSASETAVIEARPDFCERILSRSALKRAERYLINTARKPTDGFFSRNFNRHISLFLTRQLLKLRATPLQTSIGVLLVGLASGFFVGRGRPLLTIVGALLFELASIIDGCDGENARLTFRTSKSGRTVDIVSDAVIFVFFFANLPIGLYRSTGNALWLLVGGFMLLSMLLFYVQLEGYAKKSGIGTDIIAVVKDIEKNSGGQGIARKFDWLASKIAPIYRRDFFATISALIILTAGVKILVGILAVLSPLETIYIFFYTRRRLKSAVLTA